MRANYFPVLLFVLLLWPTVLLGQPAEFYSPYAAVLSTYVDDEALVDYAGLKSDRGELDTFVTQLGAFSRDEFQALSEKEQIAFLVNAYNAFTLKVIIDNYPIKSSFFRSAIYPKNSIRQISGVFTDIKFLLMGEQVTLDGIEHETLRKKYNAPYIHLALVCAAMACPPLLNEPYTAEKLDEQITKQANSFLYELGGIKLEKSNKRLYLSKIFDWFGEDFEGHIENAPPEISHLPPEPRGVVSFLYPYFSMETKRSLGEAAYSFRYLDYDWTLNDQAVGRP